MNVRLRLKKGAGIFWLCLLAILLITVAVGLFLYGAVSQTLRAAEIFEEENPDRRRQMLYEFVDALGPVRAQEELSRAAPRATNFHNLLHHLGKYMHDRFGARGFEYCLDDFHMACRHGFMMHLAEKEDIAKTEGIVGEANEGRGNTAGRYIQDSHVLGHVYAKFYRYDLAAALEGCDGFTSAHPNLSSSWCHYGVFMENADHLDVFPDLLQSQEQDIFSPCTDLGKKYRWACFTNQPRIMKLRMDRDLKKMAAACTTLADSRDRSACSEGVVRFSYTSDKKLTSEDALATCSYFPSEYQTRCAIFSATYAIWLGSNFIDFGIDICGRLDQQYQHSCLEDISDAVFLMHANSPAAKIFCEDIIEKRRDSRCEGLLKNGPVSSWNPENVDGFSPLQTGLTNLRN